MAKVTGGCEFTVYVPSGNAGIAHGTGIGAERWALALFAVPHEFPLTKRSIRPPSTLAEQVP